MNEEQIAIETLKEIASDDFDTLGDDISPKMAQNILNVIDKQQKEIEEKTTIIMAGAEKVKQLEKEIEELKIKQDNEKYFKQFKEELKSIIKGDYISKEKIREKIKEYQEKAEDVKQKYKSVYAYKDDYLEALAKIEGYQELLEEV